MANEDVREDQYSPFKVEFTLSITDISEASQSRALLKSREAYVMSLLAEGEISSGKAARLLDCSRMEMFDRMGEWNISVFDDSMSLDELRIEVDQAGYLINHQSEESE